MPIHEGILKKHAKEFVILMTGEQTLNNAIQSYQKSSYPQNDTFLVVSLPDDKYLAASLLDMVNIIQKAGADSLTQPLAELIPPASRVERADTPENGKAIVDWVASSPRSTLVVIDDDGFVALLANTDMSGGVFDLLALDTLHGEESDLGKDFRTAVADKLPAPKCPHCGHQDFYNYDPAQKTYTCKKCGKVIT